MSAKQRRNDGLVFSTNSDYFNNYEPESDAVETLPKHQQKLRTRIETKHRGGKAVVVVYGFVGNHQDLETLGKWLKTKCGTGGSVKDGEILIQGNDKDKIVQLLKNEGYTLTK